MPKVSWDKVRADLQRIDPAVAGQLRSNAEKILHHIPPRDYPADEGTDDGIMWHRGADHESPNERADGPQNYFLLYTNQDPGPGFEILAVRSIHQVGSKWVQMTMDLSDLTDTPPL